jgi:hypothetical protein
MAPKTVPRPVLPIKRIPSADSPVKKFPLPKRPLPKRGKYSDRADRLPLFGLHAAPAHTGQVQRLRSAELPNRQGSAAAQHEGVAGGKG